MKGSTFGTSSPSFYVRKVQFSYRNNQKKFINVIYPPRTGIFDTKKKNKYSDHLEQQNKFVEIARDRHLGLRAHASPTSLQPPWAPSTHRVPDGSSYP